MEAIRQIIDSHLLNGVIALPKNFQNKKVEIIVFPTMEKSAMSSFSKNDIDAMLKGSVTESLIGALPHSGMSLEDYRAERLNKYERTD
jgi:hypothetical protein